MHLNYGRILALFQKANVVEILGRFLAFGGNTSTTNQQGQHCTPARPYGLDATGGCSSPRNVRRDGFRGIAMGCGWDYGLVDVGVHV